MNILGLFFVVMALSGCATLSLEQCWRGDWYGIGLADGRSGLPAGGRIDRHMQACARHGVRVDERVYLEGHAHGLLHYCRIDNAFDSGLRGQRYQHVCPPEIDPLFDRYNSAAYRVYAIRRQLDNTERQFFNTEYRFRNRNLSRDNRRRIRRDFREMEWQRDQLRYELFSRERYLFFLMDEARDWQRSFELR